VPRPRRVPAWAAVLVVVLLAGALLRAHDAVDHGRFLSTDERAYARLAVSLETGSGYGARRMDDPLHWPPGTPALLAVGRQLSGAARTDLDPAGAYWAQWVVGVALLLVIFALVRFLTRPGSAWPAVAATALVALYPPLWAITGDLTSEPLGALTLAVATAAFAWAAAPGPRGRRLGLWSLAGAAIGASVLVRADLLLFPPVMAALAVALLWRRAGARDALASAGCLLACAALVVAPWSIYATVRKGEPVLITTSSWSSLYVGTYLPGGGTMLGLRRSLGDEARRHNPAIRDVENTNLRAEWVLDAVAGRHPGLERDEALKHETLANLRRYALGRPLDFAAMQVRKLGRMWLRYNRGSHHNPRTWILVVHLVLAATALAGLLYGLWRTRHPALWAILTVILLVTAVNSVFVSEARHNVRLMPLLIAGGIAGVVLARGRALSAALPDGPRSGGRSAPPRTRPAAAPAPPGVPSRDAAGVR
jgi:Dolichyl-phosphate-mannose-protein mannosyltransferase